MARVDFVKDLPCDVVIYLLLHFEIGLVRYVLVRILLALVVLYIVHVVLLMN